VQAWREAEEKINLIAQTIDQYKQEIEELKERLNPTTPPEVREKRKQEFALQIDEMENQAKAAEELLTEPCSYGQHWKRMRRSNSGTRKRKESRNHTRAQTKAEDNEHHRALEGHSRHEEAADRVESSADAEARKTSRIGTPPRTSNTGDCAVGGRKEK
jgi:hypothetical protein